MAGDPGLAVGGWLASADGPDFELYRPGSDPVEGAGGVEVWVGVVPRVEGNRADDPRPAPLEPALRMVLGASRTWPITSARSGRSTGPPAAPPRGSDLPLPAVSNHVDRMASGEHVLRTETLVPRPRGEVFAFFADAENLERITPPELNFQITTPLPIAMAAGTTIEYRLGLFGVRFPWTTLISAWEPDTRFVDEQLRGPYAKWVHTHSFRDADGGTLVTDEVLYRLPLYPLGEVAFPMVRLQLRRIFGYRARRLGELLGAGRSRP